MRDFKVSTAKTISVRFDEPLTGYRRDQRMQTDPPAGVSASPVPDNVMTW